MKANELMIGDWVMFGEIPVRIEEIEKVFVCDTMYYQNGDVAIAIYDPIPLTEEILEKNGFAIRYNRYEDEHKTVIRKYREGWLIDRHYPFHCAVKYIHELQHALKLCGIEKEIII